MSRGWWRRNAVALVALAVLVPATALTISFNNWNEWNLGHATDAIVVDAGASTEYGGAVVGPARAWFAEPGDYDPEWPGGPAGTRVIAVEIDIDAVDAEFRCSSVPLYDAAGREWTADTSILDLPYDSERTTYCDSEAEAPYTLTQLFIVPADATGPFTASLVSATHLPSYVSFVVDPDS